MRPGSGINGLILNCHLISDINHSIITEYTSLNMDAEASSISNEQEDNLPNLNDIVEINRFLDTDELLMPEEEKLQIDARIEKRQQELLVYQDDFDLWYDKITRRRMFALARLRKLTKAHKNRIMFYERVRMQLEKKVQYEEANNAESVNDSVVSKSVSRNTVSGNITMDDSPVIVKGDSSRLSKADSQFKTSVSEYEIDDRLVSASDTTIDSGSTDFGTVDVSMNNDLNDSNYRLF